MYAWDCQQACPFRVLLWLASHYDDGDEQVCPVWVLLAWAQMSATACQMLIGTCNIPALLLYAAVFLLPRCCRQLEELAAIYPSCKLWRMQVGARSARSCITPQLH